MIVCMVPIPQIEQSGCNLSRVPVPELTLQAALDTIQVQLKRQETMELKLSI